MVGLVHLGLTALDLYVCVVYSFVICCVVKLYFVLSLVCFYNILFMLFCSFFIEMVDVKEQHVCIKFWFRLGKTAAETQKC